MCPRRLLKMVLLIGAAVGFVADTTAFAAVRYSSRGNRTSRPTRTTRTSRPSPVSGAVANMQRAAGALNAARSEQSTAQRNLVQVRSRVNARYDNTSTLAPVREGFQTAEAAHDEAKDKVRERLKQNDASYQAATKKMTDLEARLKKVEFTGPVAEFEALKKSAREQRLVVSSLESAAFQKDSAVQSAQRERDAGTKRIQGLRKESETAIARDSEMNGAKSQMAAASSKVSAAQSNYNRAVASANAAAQAARAQAAAQAMRPRYVGSSRYGRGGRSHSSSRSSSSRFRRYR